MRQQFRLRSVCPTMKIISHCGAMCALIVSAPAVAGAQDTPDRQATVYDGDYLTIGGGVAVGPSYDGSDDTIVFPVAAFQGRLKGIGIAPRPAGFALDLINDGSERKVSFQIGPVVRARFDRHTQIKDPVVASLGKRAIAVELGGNAGFSINRLASRYDSATFSLDARHDVASAHRGTVLAPSFSYQSPLSRAIGMAVSVAAEHVDDHYAGYYFSVTPADSLVSGLPAFQARKGWKNITGGVLFAIDLDGELANGGFAIYAGGSMSRLLGNFSRAPIVAQRGSQSQITGLLGIGYTF